MSGYLHSNLGKMLSKGFKDHAVRKRFNPGAASALYYIHTKLLYVEQVCKDLTIIWTHVDCRRRGSEAKVDTDRHGPMIGSAAAVPHGRGLFGEYLGTC